MDFQNNTQIYLIKDRLRQYLKSVDIVLPTKYKKLTIQLKNIYFTVVWKGAEKHQRPTLCPPVWKVWQRWHPSLSDLSTVRSVRLLGAARDKAPWSNQTLLGHGSEYTPSRLASDLPNCSLFQVLITDKNNTISKPMFNRFKFLC